MNKEQIKRDMDKMKEWLDNREGDFEMGPGWDVMRHINTLLKEVERLEMEFKSRDMALGFIKEDIRATDATLTRYREALEEIRDKSDCNVFKPCSKIAAKALEE